MTSNFWDNQKSAQKILQQLNDVKSKYENFISLEKRYEDLQALLELCYELQDLELKQELNHETKEFKKWLEKTKLETLLSDRHDVKMQF